MKCETELSTYWPNLWVKLILLGNFSKNSLIIFEHKSRDHKSWYTPYPGAPQANCIPWAGSVGPWPWNLHQVLLPLSLTKASLYVPSLWSPVVCSSLGMGDSHFSEQGGTGTEGLSLSLVLTEGHTSGLLLVKWRLLSHTSLPLAHLPRLPWKSTCCFWSTCVQ